MTASSLENLTPLGFISRKSPEQFEMEARQNNQTQSQHVMLGILQEAIVIVGL